MPNKFKKNLPKIAAIVFIVFIISAVSFLNKFAKDSNKENSTISVDKSAQALTILSPHWEGIRVEFQNAFNKWRIANNKKPVKINWIDVGGTSDIIKYIRSSFKHSPNGIDADVFFGGGTEPYITLARENLLSKTKIPENIISNIPSNIFGQPIYDTNGYWYGAALSGFGILYNKIVTEKFDLPTPKTWKNLTAPAFRTWVGSADPRKSGSTHMMYEIILQAYGWKTGMWTIAALAGNIRAFTQSASTVPKDIAVGETAAGLCIDQYAWSTMEKVGGNRLGFSLPKGLTVVTADGIAKLKGAPQEEIATEFISFVLSEAGQKIWMLKKNTIPGSPEKFQLNKMPVWPSLFAKYKKYTYFTENPFLWKSSVKYSSPKSSARWGILNDYIGAVLIDPHKKCADAWAEVCDFPETNSLKKLFLENLISESQLMNFATNQYKDNRWRAKLLSKWANEARTKYDIIIND